MPSLSSLCGTLGYRFRDESLLSTALTHRSFGSRNYERLEFLGDSILGFLIAECLYQRFPEAPEGELSRYRAELVQQSTLATLSRRLGLGEHLQLGKGERMDGGADRDSILSDAFEALTCAIYKDGGIDTCRQVILPFFEERLAGLHSRPAPKDAKTRLQELLQGRRLSLPVYEVCTVAGKDHNQQFQVKCTVTALGLSQEGTGGTRKDAEQDAACRILDQIGQNT